MSSGQLDSLRESTSEQICSCGCVRRSEYGTARSKTVKRCDKHKKEKDNGQD